MNTELQEAYTEYQERVIKHKNMDPNYVIKLPLDEQCEYVDMITKKYVEDKNFLEKILKNFKGITQDTSACVIGNLAYISRHHSYNPILEILENLRQ